MSRVGNSPISIPDGVDVQVADGQVTVKGNKGELKTRVAPLVDVKVDSGVVTVKRSDDEKHSRAQHGLMRALIQNMITGVVEGFERKLEVNGVGYKVDLAGRKLKLSVGYSHVVEFDVPEGVDAVVDQNVITLKSIDKQLLGQTAAEIRKIRKPEPYKGKGIKYEDEYIIRKSGKTAAGGAE